jgi:hypothetical protein
MRGWPEKPLRNRLELLLLLLLLLLLPLLLPLKKRLEERSLRKRQPQLQLSRQGKQLNRLRLLRNLLIKLV